MDIDLGDKLEAGDTNPQENLLSAMLWAFELAGLRALFVDGDLNVRYCSLSLTDSSSQSPFSIRNNKLRAVPAQQSVLESLVGELLRGRKSRTGMVAAFASETNHRYMVKLARVATPSARLDQPLVAICFKSIAEDARTLPETVGLVFNLTPAESRLASELACGSAISAAASSAGITLNTARDRLKSIFAKTRTKRQAELVSLIARQLW